MESTKVIIVGGGAAGLAAAKTLGSNVDYLLIEAQSYIGGRIHTVDAVPNVSVDMGAQFIHGEVNNILYDICKPLNCILPVTDIKCNEMLAITSDQTTIDPEIVRQVFIVWDEFFHDAQAKFDDKTIPIHESFSDYLHKHLKERLLSSIPSLNNLVDAFCDFFYKVELIENGCFKLSDLSLAEYGSYQSLDGLFKTEFKNGGYRPFISYMKSFISNDNRIRLNSEVIRVKYLKENHQLLVDIRHHNKTSEQQQLSTILCDHIIWTSSLGYLKENFSSIFADEIELIEQKRDAINNLGIDSINKVITVYEKSFWPDNVGDIILLHAQKQKSIQFSDSLKNLLKTEKIDVQVVNTIIEAIHRYEVLPSTNVPIIICWFGGPAAVLLEDLSEYIIGQICHEVLCYYLNISSKLNKIIRVLKSEWNKNRFIRGSYSYYSIKSSAKDGEKLRAAYAPDGIPRIQFAGEATSERAYATVHGALESGIREGNILLSIMNR
ncbi:unnamed protein product [Rotaria sp. Silwood2]|nr:unnamed protein product [Rotaria sp. Silwood2]CAF2646809.1 unnamed protein product [Rotaria sp. Silwood2]CAF2865944.1 unnamed protein product [Rotaria sp. Silwood2]CAF3004988.1 unnamed protein product [Rotaria sp. Silwood2]CAF4380238.1 unnamed protein product [Rotaria sp. Silwood2]